MSSNRLNIFALPHIIQKQYLRSIGLGLFYVMILIALGQYCSTTISRENESQQLNAGLRFDEVNPLLYQVRRQSRYVQHINRPSGILNVRSTYEQCTAILLSDRLVLTAGNCAKALDLPVLKGRRWSAISKHLPKYFYTQSQSTLEAKIIKSHIHPAHQLAIHLLDQPLPYVPIMLPLGHSHLSNWQKTERISDGIDKQHTRQFGQFLIGRQKNSADLIVLGRLDQQIFNPLLSEELGWITYVRKQMGSPAIKRLLPVDSLALSQPNHKTLR